MWTLIVEYFPSENHHKFKVFHVHILYTLCANLNFKQELYKKCTISVILFLQCIKNILLFLRLLYIFKDQNLYFLFLASEYCSPHIIGNDDFPQYVIRRIRGLVAWKRYLSIYFLFSERPYCMKSCSTKIYSANSNSMECENYG